ncbi:hypothetical protein [Roseateles sp. PN1]|uniref:hypothetical protein n=1 Tax=Roseateles sp. PN1 TaxID=3137372 RepID=UPI00313869C8
MSATEQAPIACTLGPADMGPRLARIRQLTKQHLRAHRLEDSSLHLSYDGAAASEVEHIVKLERECCAFLDYALSRRGDDVELTIVGPEQSGSDAQRLFSQFLPENMSAAQPPGCGCRKG